MSSTPPAIPRTIVLKRKLCDENEPEPQKRARIEEMNGHLDNPRKFVDVAKYYLLKEELSAQKILTKQARVANAHSVKRVKECETKIHMLVDEVDDLKSKVESTIQKYECGICLASISAPVSCK